MGKPIQRLNRGDPKMDHRLCFEMPRKKLPPSDFGDRLVALRKARGLTQVELAQATSSTQRAISYYENHASFPPAPAVIALAKALGVSTDELLGVAERKSDRRETDPENQRLWKKFRQVGGLPERDQRAVIRLINSLAAATQGPRSAAHS
jgi:transcriptional regulator with XRE-family HTH domain